MLIRVLLLLVLGLAAWPASAQLEGLEDTPPAYRTALRNAIRAFSARDFKTTAAMVDEADKMLPATPTTINIRAAVAIEEKRYAEGRELCLKALNMNPRFFPARFNLAEIPFMQGKYAEARLGYEKLVNEDPKEELLKFRIFLTYLLEKNEAKAKEELDSIPLLNDTPIYFFAQSA